MRFISDDIKHFKANPYHDEHGRFTSAEEDGGVSQMTGVQFESSVINSLRSFGVDNVREINGNITPQQVAAYSEQLNKLASEYHTGVEGSFFKGVEVRFESTDKIKGQVLFGASGAISQINLGSDTDFKPWDREETIEEQEELEEEGDMVNLRLLNGAPIDYKNRHLYTLTHEMGHAIAGLSNGFKNTSNQKAFWSSARALKDEYHLEISSKNMQKVLGVHLGEYASTSVDEFVAEGFTEYKLNSSPSKYAEAIGQLYDKHFGKKKKSLKYNPNHDERGRFTSEDDDGGDGGEFENDPPEFNYNPRYESRPGRATAEGRADSPYVSNGTVSFGKLHEDPEFKQYLTDMDYPFADEVKAGDLSGGLCSFVAAYQVQNAPKGVETAICTQFVSMGLYHAFAKIGDKFYDGDAPKGVSNPKDLPIYKGGGAPPLFSNNGKQQWVETDLKGLEDAMLDEYYESMPKGANASYKMKPRKKSISFKSGIPKGKLAIPLDNGTVIWVTGGREFGKGNPNHDERGRFTSEDNDSAGEMTEDDFEDRIVDTLSDAGFHEVDEIVAGGYITPQQRQAYDKQIAALTSEYNMPESVASTSKILFRSDGKKLGGVTYNQRGEPVIINFGNNVDKDRVWGTYGGEDGGRVWRDATYKSPVDKDKIHLSTMTHEMAHVISGRSYIPTNDEQRNFWKDAKKLAVKYHQEMVSDDLVRKNKIHLGYYASTNNEEFVAEAFTEYKLNSSPSPYAKEVGKLYDKHFGKKKKSFSYSQSGIEIQELFNDN